VALGPGSFELVGTTTLKDRSLCQQRASCLHDGQSMKKWSFDEEKKSEEEKIGRGWGKKKTIVGWVGGGEKGFQ